MTFTRRQFLLSSGMLTATAALSACSSTSGSAGGKDAAKVKPLGYAAEGGNRGLSIFGGGPELPLGPFDPEKAYAGLTDGEFKLPPVPWKKVNPEFRRQVVANTTGERAGTLVVDVKRHALYWTLRGGQAIRYGVGLGKAGFEWSGEGEIRNKTEWPRWHPPEEMIARKPELTKYKTTYDKKNNAWLGGMDPGPSNPLGARALYIYQNGVDTLFRLHGTPEWSSIGKSVSSGCVRFINQDIIDLFDRVPNGTRIIVR